MFRNFNHLGLSVCEDTTRKTIDNICEFFDQDAVDMKAKVNKALLTIQKEVWKYLYTDMSLTMLFLSCVMDFTLTLYL